MRTPVGPIRAVVTGGAGFIGSTLTDQLLELGHRVVAVDNLATGSLGNMANACGYGNRFVFEQADIRSRDFQAIVEHHRPDVIFHLAAQASVNASLAHPAEDASVNILGSLRVLDAAVDAGVRKVVFAASGGTLYGDIASSDLPAKEHLPRTPTSPYGIAKKCVLDYLDHYRRFAGLETTALALANVYGPRQDPTGEAGVIAIFTHQALEGESLSVTGDGTQTRDFVYVTDVAAAFIQAAIAPVCGVINIGTGIERSVIEIAETICRQARTSSPIEYLPPRAGEVFRNCLDPSLAAQELSWIPRVSFCDGIDAVIESHRALVRA